ncbi:MAG TPA: potassium-transporting ATPase subunit KdpC [Pirellulaceae bacterium]|nr:potassium-transporting ATPase subunit KdpC [Pirellulaceae bacterium]
MNDYLISLRLTIFSLVICSAAYPAVILGLASVAAPYKRQGSLVHDQNGTVVGSWLLAQKFTRPEYFWPRPSAVDYNASATGGSNKSPTNPDLTRRAAETLAQLQPGEGQLVPADLVAASGSGLDPNITLAAARFQAPRVAQARKLSVEKVEELINQHTDSPTLAIFGGEPLVNILLLNLALDDL